MKTSSIFCCFLLLVACSVGKLVDTPDPIAKIEQQKVYFENGQKRQLPIAKEEVATVIYLVRHAEKAKEGGRDPILTPEGKKRANKLRKILEGVGINKVYSTDYQRTQLTAAPTAEISGQKILSYNPSKLKEFAEDLKIERKGQQILVVGHSNTTPVLVNALIGAEQYPMIDEQEYGHLFMVILRENGTKEAFDLRY